jgi:hypothetical protein
MNARVQFRKLLHRRCVLYPWKRGIAIPVLKFRLEVEQAERIAGYIMRESIQLKI